MTIITQKLKSGKLHKHPSNYIIPGLPPFLRVNDWMNMIHGHIIDTLLSLLNRCWNYMRFFLITRTEILTAFYSGFFLAKKLRPPPVAGRS
jgi:hypothetical protein